MVARDMLVYPAAMAADGGLDDSVRAAPVRADDALGGRSRFDDGLVRLGDRERGDDAARARSREHWLRRQADEEATFSGVLVDLAERGDRVAVATVTGRRHRGWLRGVGADFCVLETDDAQQVVVRLGALASVRPEPGQPFAGGDRGTVGARTLADHLASLADHRPRVLVATIAPAESIGGALHSVGRDVLVVALDGQARGLAYVPVASVAEVSLPVSG
jgi:hypothetical protein